MEFILLFLVVIAFLYFMSRKKQLEVKESLRKNELRLKKIQEKENKLKKLKENEDIKLSFEKSVMCDDGVERKYSESMYGIIEEKILEAYGRKQIMIKFGYTNYDVGMQKRDDYISAEQYFNPKKKRKPVIVEVPIEIALVSRKKWFSKSGKILNSKQILDHSKNYTKKKWDYNDKYSTVLRRRGTPSPIEFASIYIINDIYFKNKVSDFYYSNLELFNGQLNNLIFRKGRLVK